MTVLARVSLLAALAGVACGTAQTAVAPETPSAAAAPVAAQPALPPPVSSAPTVLSAEDKRRDAAREPLATAVVDAYPNWNGLFSGLIASWSPDGKSILFGSLRDGLPEIFLADPIRPSAAPRAITTGPERALWASFTRDGKWILFTRDQKGDENHAIWRIAPDGSGLTNLTPGEIMHRDEPLLPRGLPGIIYYSASRTTSPSSHLYRLDLAGGEPKLIYSQPAPGGALDVSRDGARVLFLEFRAEDDAIVREVEVATGRARRLFPAEGIKASVYGASYADGGKRVVLSTDRGDHVELLGLDVATGKALAHYVDQVRTAELGMSVSPRGELVALQVNAGNHGLVRILDARTLKIRREVKVPLGEVHVGEWSDDGRAFSIMISMPTQPPDVFAVDAATGKVTPLRDDPRPGLASLPPLTVSIEKVKAFDGLTIPVNVYLPKVEGTKRLPTLIVFHGGPTSSYAVRWSAFTRFYTALGYAVIEPNVRGSSGFGLAYALADNREKRADWLKDVATTNAWAKMQPWCDPDRVVVFGGSYGGYTTLMAMTRQPTLWRAGVDLFGPADLKAFLLSTDQAIRSIFVAEFGDLEKDAALLELFSPIRDVDKIARPLFVYAGANDPRVPLSEDDTIVKALRARGVPVEYMVAANEGHSIDRRENKIELLTRTARFLEDALK